MAKYEYDIVCIGLGPAGMAVSVMGSMMGLKVCAVEKHRIGGECMNVGCIPSKALLQIARYRHAPTRFADFGLSPGASPAPEDPFARIQQHLKFISEKKTLRMFDQVDLLLGQGAASFVDPHTVAVGGKKITAKRIFIAAGTSPMILPIPGIDSVENILTNENLFELEKVPESMIILGGGAIACEMAQAFQRLGCRVSMVQRSPHILSRGEPAAAELLEAALREEGVNLLTGRLVKKVECRDGRVVLHTDQGETVEAERLLAGSGRLLDYAQLRLAQAGVGTTEKGGIRVDRFLRTSQKHIYAVGDCNGYHLYSHAAMHQGMIALINSMLPRPFKRDFRRYAVPYTVFTEPQISHVGWHEHELKERRIAYETVETRYQDYGAAIAEGLGRGYVRAYVGRLGRIHGVDIVGEGSGEMINEWALAVQKKIRIHDIMLLQHSFPTMGFMSKRVGELWMTGRMKSPWLRKLATWAFRFP